MSLSYLWSLTTFNTASKFGWKGEPSYATTRIPQERIDSMKVHIIQPVYSMQVLFLDWTHWSRPFLNLQLWNASMYRQAGIRSSLYRLSCMSWVHPRWYSTDWIEISNNVIKISYTAGVNDTLWRSTCPRRIQYEGRMAKWDLLEDEWGTIVNREEGR